QQAMINLALNARSAIGDRLSAVGSRPSLADSRQPAVENRLIFRVREDILTGERTAFPQNVPGGQYVVLEVEDNGIGRTPEVLNQALDPFFTTKEVGQGTGLGLPVVFGIVQGHQGYLTIRSSPTAGTCMSLYLPRLIRPPESQRCPPAAEPGLVLEPETTPGFHILVV